MARYIDADAVDFSPLKNEFDRARAKVIIMGQPTADVVPVVRCKDCVFWDTESIGFSDEHICKMHSIVAVHSRYTNPTDYCSYGERQGNK